jgi:hypothetical protein
MSTKSMSVIAGIVAGVVLLIVYAVVTANADQPQALRWWATTMLIFLGVAIVVQVIVQIAFRIVLAVALAARIGDSRGAERVLDTTMAEDEMDRVIELKAARIGYVFLGIGVLGMLVTLACAGPAELGLNILFWSFAAGSLATGVATVYGFERGVRA